MSNTNLAMPLRIFLIYHAETGWTLAHRYTGRVEGGPVISGLAVKNHWIDLAAGA